MKNHRHTIVVAAVAVAAFRAAQAAPTVSPILTWPGPNELLYMTNGLTRSGQEFFGTAEMSSKAPRKQTGAVYRLTPPVGGGTSWKADIIFNLDAQPAQARFEPLGPLVIDSEKRIYSLIANGAQQGPVDFITMLQKPASGAGIWTNTVIYTEKQTTAHEFLNTNGLFTDGKDHLFGEYVGSNQSQGIFELSSNAAYTSWKRTNIATNVNWYQGSLPVFDKAGNMYVVTARSSGKAPASIIELSPPALHGSPWSSTTLWTAASGQLTRPVGLAFGPHADLYVTAGTDGKLNNGGLFKLTRPVSPSTVWTYETLYTPSSYKQPGYAPESSPIVDRTGAVFYQASVDIVRVARAAPPHDRWTVTELAKFNENELPFPLATDAAGDILVPSNLSSPQVLDVAGTGFVPQRKP